MTSASLTNLIQSIDSEEVAELAFQLGRIEAPAGAEGPAADAVEAWMREEGFAPRRIGLVEDRPSIVSRLRGSGAGPTLIFNAHLDTAISRFDTLTYIDPAQPKYISAWREEDRIFGNGVVNDKAPMAAFLIAAAAIRRSGTRLAGDLVLHAVPGEIGLEPVDEFQGPNHLGKDLGARYAIAHGVIGDAALVAEATGNAIGWVQPGKAFFKVTVFGGEPLYTPFTPAEADPVKNPNAIVRLAPVIMALNRWTAGYAERTYECPGGTVVPKATIGAIRSGRPDKITKSTELAILYLDIRIAPDVHPMSIQRELESVLARTDVPFDVECFLYRRGYEAQGIESLAEATRAAHREEFGTDPGLPAPPVTSMWRDITPFNEAGIPSLTYGPSSSTGGGNFSVGVDELAATARVYARTAVRYCGLAE
ncbi:MAG TPA: M20/M25/M40 family metallo-hydrolase [Acidimicrobiia bacterium]|nr:M20/M25/M40 family metallo-hydrolase [Acidimicrobiia bacterium]